MLNQEDLDYLKWRETAKSYKRQGIYFEDGKIKGVKKCGIKGVEQKRVNLKIMS